ncbi:MAG: hypothetical protein Q9170_004745 [Blastenia crenularia]
MDIVLARASLSRGPFLFLSLPLELRRQVYVELLTSSHQVVWHDRHDRHRHPRRLHIHPQILLANKQINAEATPILYGQNTLTIDIYTTVIRQCSGEVLRLLSMESAHAGLNDGHDPKSQRKRKWLTITVQKDEKALLARKRKKLRDLEKEKWDEEMDWSDKAMQYFNKQNEMADSLVLLVEAVTKKRDVEVVEVEAFTNLTQTGERMTMVKARKVELEDLDDL